MGETEEATFFGYGYAQAEDHLERMMLQCRGAIYCTVLTSRLQDFRINAA